MAEPKRQTIGLITQMPSASATLCLDGFHLCVHIRSIFSGVRLFWGQFWRVLEPLSPTEIQEAWQCLRHGPPPLPVAVVHLASTPYMYYKWEVAHFVIVVIKGTGQSLYLFSLLSSPPNRTSSSIDRL